MKKAYVTILCLALSLISFAQTSDVSIFVADTETNQPLPGATVYFEELEKGAITNFDGIATFTEIPNGNQAVKISYVGFRTIETTIEVGTKKEFFFKLESGRNELDEVVIQSSRSTRTVRKIPTRIEFIGVEELGEKAVMNPTNISMVLRESTGIQMQQTSLSSGNTNIRIQGLDGRYTQLLRDGFPLYGGFSSGLSILQIPPLDLQQFEIIKGSSSTLYGGGAIAGLINMVSKTPDEEPSLDFMLTQTQALGSTANVFYSVRNEKFGVSLYGSGHYQKAYDPEDDGFSNLPKTTSLSFNPKFFYYPSDKTTFWIGLNGTYDDRIGGDITKIESGENGIHQYTEENLSKRLSSQTVYEKQMDSVSSLNIKNSISFFDRKLSIPDFSFDGKQTNTFTEINYQKASKKADWIIGANLYTSNFDENDNATLQRDQRDVTYGTFVNNIYDISDNWILETGLRADYNTDFGFFPLPRVSLLYKNDSGFSSRIGGGLGYKIPDIFTEEAENINFENVLAIDKAALKAERSYGVNFDVNYQARLFDAVSFSINQLFYVSAINNGLLLNSTDDGFFTFENATDKIISKGAETNIKFTYKDFRWFLNYALIDTKLNYLAGNPQKPLTAKHNVGSVLMYESDKWRIGYETFYIGKQFLSTGTETTDFVTMGFVAMRNFKWGTTFLNFENFTDRRQSRFSPLVLPPHDSPEFPEIYAPTDGFIFSVGVIIKPFGNEDED
ncbi:Vitamin B12 transporter BtuB [Arenibacter antarcticus]|jgi:iron complex outermembrane receptor protein|uniref:TonB-dependent receptor domain-containing protein n=1 Tax=Arenibacter antarcticus TaxID=2040469 RepID=A0ABW5VAU0_9FLAO|nr:MULTISPECIES: TonB-dependent receptor [Arenibacter]MCM4167583.1 TonB-dependent receptor [Arenibacter sp. H213]MDO6604056.1 TonB-dependent receptor [Arenibacter palladensis]|tara:strand:+ start:5762 stop:7945 length:2184 start_codon:yes stop_codon:yes gene_type:complete